MCRVFGVFADEINTLQNDGVTIDGDLFDVLSVFR